MSYDSIKIFYRPFLCKAMKSIVFSVYLFSSTPLYIVYVILLLLALYSEAENNFLKLFSQYFVVLLIFFTVFLFITLNLKISLSFLAKWIGISYIDKYFPLSKNGVRALNPVLLFGSTIVAAMVIESLSMSKYESLHNEKVESLRRESSRLYEEGDLYKAFKKGDQGHALSSHPIFFKGILKKIINSNAISYIVDFFRIEK